MLGSTIESKTHAKPRRIITHAIIAKIQLPVILSANGKNEVTQYIRRNVIKYVPMPHVRLGIRTIAITAMTEFIT